MIFTYDMATQALTVDTSRVRPNGTNIEARLKLYGQTVQFIDLHFGAVVTADGVEVYRRELPRPGEVWINSDQELIWADALRWSPDQAIEVHAWISNGPEDARLHVETTQQFNVPRPAQPYPSWTWGGTAWVAPLAYPTDGGEYEWNEAGQAWVAI